MLKVCKKRLFCQMVESMMNEGVVITIITAQVTALGTLKPQCSCHFLRDLFTTILRFVAFSLDVVNGGSFFFGRWGHIKQISKHTSTQMRG
uniref:Uncharacterized protein n=1 Tax=Rhipicephalus zambeziensis TaxID=60191 RepID=A0A224YHI1_9ACAR